MDISRSITQNMAYLNENSFDVRKIPNYFRTRIIESNNMIISDIVNFISLDGLMYRRCFDIIFYISSHQ
jgi:hypothetical protein